MQCQGVYTALLTPLQDCGKIHWDSLSALIDLQLRARVTGVVICASTGEGHAFSLAERGEILSFCLQKSLGEIQVIMGLPTNNTLDAVAWADQALRLGAHGCLLATPYYNKPTQDGMYQHYLAVCKVGLPVMAYNVPSRTASALAPDTLRKLSMVPNFVCLKDSAGDVDGFSALMLMDSCEILCGNDSQILPWMALGALGVVSVCSNVLPEEIVLLYRYCVQNDFVKAKQLHYQLLPLMQSLFYQTNPICIKWLAFKRGVISTPHVRLPLLPLQDLRLQEKLWKNLLSGENNS